MGIIFKVRAMPAKKATTGCLDEQKEKDVLLLLLMRYSMVVEVAVLSG